MKFCPTCKTSKSLDCFHKYKGKKDGLRANCKMCLAEAFRIASQSPKYREAHE